MLTTTERPLSPAETRSLAVRIGRARRESWLALTKTAIESLLIGGVLGLFIFVGSRQRSGMIVAFLVLAVLLSLLISLPRHRVSRLHIASLEDAMRASRVRTRRVQSSRVVEFEKDEHEGASYAFEVDAWTCLFVVGPEFEQDGFPNSDFSIVELLGSRGRPVDSTLGKTGRRLTPDRVIPANVKRLVDIPEHMTTVTAAIERVEHELGKPRGRGYA